MLRFPAVSQQSVVSGCANTEIGVLQRRHLASDQNHDFPGIFEKYPFMQGAVPQYAAKTSDDQEEIFMAGDIPSRAERLALEATFYVQNQTAFFATNPSVGVSLFEGTDARNVGVVQDAGFQLYSVLGARNVITYGSIIDQGGKPINDFVLAPLSEPLTLSGCVFGYSSDYVKDITISDIGLTRNVPSVKCVYTVRGREDDGGGLNIHGGSVNTQRTQEITLSLNTLGGDFQSPNVINALNEYAVSTNVPLPSNPTKSIALDDWNAMCEKAKADKRSGILARFVGKALGDALICYSLTGKHNPEKTGIVERCLVNTGDRWVASRCWMLGVNCVWYAPGKRGEDEAHSTKKCTFRHGNLYRTETSDQKKTRFLAEFVKVIGLVDAAYKDLDDNLASSLVQQSGKVYFRHEFSTVGGTQLFGITDWAKKEQAANQITYIRQIVNVFRIVVNIYLRKVQDELQKRGADGIQKFYDSAVVEAAKLAPGTAFKQGKPALSVPVLKTPGIDIGVSVLTKEYVEGLNIGLSLDYTVQIQPIKNTYQIPLGSVLSAVKNGRPLPSNSIFSVFNLAQQGGVLQSVKAKKTARLSKVEQRSKQIAIQRSIQQAEKRSVLPDVFGFTLHRPRRILRRQDIALPEWNDMYIRYTDILKAYYRFYKGTVSWPALLQKCLYIYETVQKNSSCLIDPVLYVALMTECSGCGVIFEPVNEKEDTGYTTVEATEFNAFCCWFNARHAEEYESRHSVLDRLTGMADEGMYISTDDPFVAELDRAAVMFQNLLNPIQGGGRVVIGSVHLPPKIQIGSVRIV